MYRCKVYTEQSNQCLKRCWAVHISVNYSFLHSSPFFVYKMQQFKHVYEHSIIFLILISTNGPYLWRCYCAMEIWILNVGKLWCILAMVAFVNTYWLFQSRLLVLNGAALVQNTEVLFLNLPSLVSVYGLPHIRSESVQNVSFEFEVFLKCKL